MQYLAMIYGDAGWWEALSDDERTATYAPTPRGVS